MIGDANFTEIIPAYVGKAAAVVVAVAVVGRRIMRGGVACWLLSCQGFLISVGAAQCDSYDWLAFLISLYSTFYSQDQSSDASVYRCKLRAIRSGIELRQHPLPRKSRPIFRMVDPEGTRNRPPARTCIFLTPTAVNALGDLPYHPLISNHSVSHFQPRFNPAPRTGKSLSRQTISLVSLVSLCLALPCLASPD